MKRLAVLLAFVCTASLGCWLTKPPPVTPNVPDGGFADASPGTVFEDCSDAALHTAWVNLIPTAEVAVASGSIDAAVATLADSLGAPLAIAEFVCAVEWVVMKAEQQAPATADSLEAKKVSNGRAWLAKQAQRPVNVSL